MRASPSCGDRRGRRAFRAHRRPRGDTVFFAFLFPAVMLSIFSVAFSSTGNVGTAPDGSGGITQAAYYLPGMIAAGILLSGIQNLGTDIATERSDGTLKRLAGTPFPVMSYFIGKPGQVFVTSAAQIVILLLLARFAFGVELPADADKWMTFGWVYILQFISGVHLAFTNLPEWLQNIASVLPLKWLAQGMAIVLATWLVGGVIVTRLTFRWIGKDS